MEIKFFTIDNYFNNPDHLREIALSLDHYRVDNELGPPGGWRGKRSLPFRRYKNDVLNKCEEKIFKDCYELFNLENYIHPYSKGKVGELTITSYFHISTEETRSAFYDFWQDRFHKDFLPCAGVIYLNPHAPLNSGTTIVDAKNCEMIQIENKYNQLLVYDGFVLHALSDVFGTNDETGRLTYTFFIHEKTQIFDQSGRFD